MSDKQESDPEAAGKATNRLLIWWCVGTLLVVGSTWFLLKGDGRQVVAAAGELLITMSRPTAIEPPYPVEDLGGQWGLLVLGELEAKYARMTVMFALWGIGSAMLFGLLLKNLRRAGLGMTHRIALSLAGLAVFAAGVLLLQAAFRSGANYQRMAGVGGVDPFTAAQLLPLSLATKACVWLSVASLLLSAVVGLALRSKVVQGYSAPSYRLAGFKWCTLLSFAALAVLVVYSAMTLTGDIPEMLEVRLDVMTEPKIVKQLNGMWAGLKWSGLGTQLGGLLWVVAAWVAPGPKPK
jgi:hypothetical protein